MADLAINSSESVESSLGGEPVFLALWGRGGAPLDLARMAPVFRFWLTSSMKSVGFNELSVLF